MKRLVIGDIHGCYAEIHALLEVSGLTESDEIIALGDIVDRGPASPEVLNFFRNNSRARVIKGNHERKHIRRPLKTEGWQIKQPLSLHIHRSEIQDTIVETSFSSSAVTNVLTEII